tara:strand:- start:10187 stop:10579 length:393 start_codon:yes stop_codon:yes gene_type:complete
MKDKKTVLSALKKLGVPASMIQVAEEGKTLTLQGYYSSAKAEVDILVEKDFHNGYSGFGFSKNPDGTYGIHVDDMDDRGGLVRETSASESFSQSVNQWYSALKAQKALKSQGLTAKVKEEGGKLVVLARG